MAVTAPDYTLSNSEDVIDSRDVIARIEDLQALRDEGALSETDQEELDDLEALAAEGENYAEDWQYGATLIRDSHFKNYAMYLAEDLHGDAIVSASWPFTCIDWAQAARELQMDYTAIEFSGVRYWVR